MAQHLMTAAGLGLLVTLANADVLRDPTMPVNQSLMPNQTSGERLAPVLQSVTLGSELKYAMINGKSVQLGAQYEQSVLVKLSANEAVLKAPDGVLQVLRMDFPIQKTPPQKSSKNPVGGTTKPLKANMLTPEMK
jgi:hypothetical protein